MVLQGEDEVMLRITSGFDTLEPCNCVAFYQIAAPNTDLEALTKQSEYFA